MRPKVFTVVASAAGNTFSPAYPIDVCDNPTTIGVGVDIVFGAASAGYSVQHTFDDPWSINLNTSPNGNSVTTGIWHNNATLANQTANGDTNYAFPPRAIRLMVSAAASASVRMVIIQAGPR